MEVKSEMSKKRNLVVFYSRNGRMRRFGQVLAARLDAAVEEIRTPCIHNGPWGCIQGRVSALLTRPVKLEALRHDPADFDLVIVGFPTWVGQIAPPVRSYLMEHAGELGRTAYFTMLREPTDAQVFGEVARITGRAPENSLAIMRADRWSGRDADKIGHFVAGLAHTVRVPAPRPTVATVDLPNLVGAIGAVGPS